MAHAGGRPLKFQSVEELQTKIEEYFNGCWGPKIGPFGPIKDAETNKVVFVQVKPYTISGLAVALDCDRDTLLNYEELDEFFGTIKRAKQRCHAYAEESLFMGNATGPIFNLKNNWGWVDKTLTDVTSKGEAIGGALDGSAVDAFVKHIKHDTSAVQTSTD